MRYAKLRKYEEWLRAEGYQPSTVEVTLRHLYTVNEQCGQTLFNACPMPVAPYRIPHVRRYLRYVALTRRNPLGRIFVAEMKRQGIEASSEIRKQGQRTKQNLTKSQWSELRKLLRAGDNTSKLLLAYMLSPYRISEFLDMEVRLVSEEDITDHVSRKWLHATNLAAPKSKRTRKLYELLCPTKRCAYSRLRRTLREAGEKLKVPADLDTLYKSYHALEDAA
ncbi:MAG: hypothetical protein V3T11_09985 [Roseateles sp.]